MKAWQGYTSTADWTAVAACMNALQKLHESTCYLEASPDGSVFGGAVIIRVMLQRQVPGPGLETRELGVAAEWPNSLGLGFEMTILRALYSLDAMAVAQWWEQNRLVP